MKPARSEFIRIGWNGIRLAVPDRWEVSRIGLRYLHFEDGAGPRLEIKWGPIRGRFSHGKQLSRLASVQKGRAGSNVSACEPPPGWEKALGRYDARFFAWQNETMGGTGALIYCAECHTWMLLQFFSRSASPDTPLFPKILASLKDHSRDGRRFWSVYDIRATTPPGFDLTRYRLDAGAFELHLTAPESKLSLYRWGPANILMKERDLMGFARVVWRLPEKDPAFLPDIGSEGLEWRIAASKGIWSGIWARIRPGHAFQSYRIWREKGKNRILGMTRTGKRPPAPGLLNQICNDYESI